MPGPFYGNTIEYMPVTMSQLASFPPGAFAQNSGITITDLSNIKLVNNGGSWRPAGGRQLLYSRNGTVAVPLATITGNSTSQNFALPDSLRVPTGLATLYTQSKISVEFWARRTGAVGAFTASARFGTGNNTSDQSFGTYTIAATSTNELRCFASAKFGTSSSSFVADGGVLAANSTGTASQADRSATINTFADMYMNLGVQTDCAAGDSFAITSYFVWIEG